MHILQLCKKFPVPLNDGESIAVTNLSRGLFEHGVKLTLLAMNTVRHPVDVEAYGSELNHYEDVYEVEVDNRLKVADAFFNLFSRKSFHIDRYDVPEFRSKLIEILQSNQFDLIQLETPFLSPYIDDIKAYSKAPIIMRAHNVEFEIWESICNNMPAGPKRWYLKYLTSKLKSYEISMLKRYHGLLAITERDLEAFRAFGYCGPGIAVPIGLNIREYPIELTEHENTSLSISFIGSLDWMPNTEGLEWFLTKIWPEIQAKFPDISFHIAGRNAPENFDADLPEQVFFHGEVEDACTFIRSCDVMLVPLKTGSGMRAKILEGMALSKTVISTSIGAEGIPAEHMETIIIADTCKGLSEAIEWCYTNKEAGLKIGKNSRKFVEKYFHYNFVAANVLDFYHQTLTLEPGLQS